ncbi:MAG: type II secretion system protein [Gemmatimonadales bacterium]|nr:type II secretion system protein [Gemmatimonadales bacterium]
MRRGFTLLEVVMVLMIVGLLASLALPGAAALADRLAVEHEVMRIVVAYRSAWSAARAQHRLALLRITADSLAIRTVGGSGAADTVLAWLAPGPANAGVVLRSSAHSILFGPDGVAMGAANARHVLERGGVRREVVVSRLGRVRVQP